MREKILNKQIPSLIGILVIVVGIVFTTILVKTGVIFTGQASPTHTPKNITITNITDNSFTISYLTEEMVVGSVSYGEDKSTDKTALDDRDQLSGKISQYKIHNFTLHNLKPETNYSFFITSTNEKFLNNGALFSVLTGKTIDTTPLDVEPITGKVVLPSGGPPSEGIVYFGISGAQNFSSLLKSDGSYLIPLNSVRNVDLASYFDFSNSTEIKILALGDGLESRSIISSNQTSPTPTITLSYNYDFRAQQDPLTATPSGNFPTFDSIEEAVSSSSSATITNPKPEGKLSDQQPTFQGTAPPGETVEIVIQSDPIKTTVKSNSAGQWSYRPPTKLAPGNHTITITTKNADGIIQTIKRSFTVYASGDQVSESATPSATTSPSPKASASSSPIASISPSPLVSPSAIASPDPSPSVSPLPATGSNSTSTFAVVGFLLVVLGGVLFLISRGAIHI